MFFFANKVVMKTGIVRSVHDGYVLVAPITQMNIEIEVKSKWELKKGDIVKFAYFIPKVYFYKFVTNVVPFLDFIFFYLLAFYIVKYHIPKYIDYIQIINAVSAFAGFIFSKGMAWYFDKYTTVFDEYKPVILAVMQRNKVDEK